MKRPIIIAHRGAPEYCPENTISSFKKAIELGADMIEVDARLTKDGKVVIQFYPKSEKEMMIVAKIFKKNGFKVNIIIDNPKNPKKRTIYVLLNKG